MKKQAALCVRLVLAGFLVNAFIPEATGLTNRRDMAARPQSAPDPDIRKCLNRINEVLATRNLETIMSVFDDTDDIIVVGSDTGEIFIGRERVKYFMQALIDMPFVFSFEMDLVSINAGQNTAWAFVDGKMVHTKNDGTALKIPYRIMAVMVKKDSGWKWKVFSGSIPRGE